MPRPIHFAKYDEIGAYHWRQCDRFSRVYNPPLEARYEVVRRRLQPGWRVLDVGCGDGCLTAWAPDIVATAIGLDSEITAVKLARKMLGASPGCHVFVGSCYELPFSSGAFDAVILADVIEHLECPDACLSEASRVLSPCGTLLLTTPKRRPDRKWDPRHVKEYAAPELARLLAERFAETELRFFWPARWTRFHETRIGFRLVPLIARHFSNPFLREAEQSDGFGQILAVCRKPRQAAQDRLGDGRGGDRQGRREWAFVSR